MLWNRSIYISSCFGKIKMFEFENKFSGKLFSEYLVREFRFPMNNLDVNGPKSTPLQMGIWKNNL